MAARCQARGDVPGSTRKEKSTGRCRTLALEPPSVWMTRAMPSWRTRPSISPTYLRSTERREPNHQGNEYRCPRTDMIVGPSYNDAPRGERGDTHVRRWKAEVRRTAGPCSEE